ncbi:MAG: DNA polymerase III subunit delta [Proteobacteria bacterium]|nr:DNA polymerase III subunit delta [Pseudomonadota bacterium]
MKIDARRLPAFLRDPGACRVVLLYGEDTGLIRDRAEALVRAVAGRLDDPFLVAELAGRDAIGRIAAEAASLPMTGGRRVVRVRDAGDAAAPAVQAVLDSRAPGLVVLEAGELPARSRLRTLAEGAADAAAIACYPEEGAALENTIRATLSEAGVTVQPEALAWLAGQLGADRAATRRELEKLALYAGPGGQVDLDAAQECVGDFAGLSLDDAVFAAAEGDVQLADRALETAMAEGAAPVQVLRAMLGHVQRLQRARAAMTDGASAEEAMRSLRPPVFFRRAPSFKRALGLWGPAVLEAAAAAMAEAERQCKRTGMPDATICRNAVLTLARRARRAAER